MAALLGHVSALSAREHEAVQRGSFPIFDLPLGGSAAQAIAGIPVTDSCYNDALEILKRRFGNVEIMEHEYLQNFRILNHVSSSSNVSALPKLLDMVELNRRGPHSLGMPQSSYAAMLYDVLLRVIPADIPVDHYKKESIENTTGNRQTSTQEHEYCLSFSESRSSAEKKRL